MHDPVVVPLEEVELEVLALEVPDDEPPLEPLVPVALAALDDVPLEPATELSDDELETPEPADARPSIVRV